MHDASLMILPSGKKQRLPNVALKKGNPKGWKEAHLGQGVFSQLT